jgi:branched-chain amino acid transport system substrate-binding protein
MKTALITLLVVAGCADILDIPDRQLASEARCSGDIHIKALFDASGPTSDVGLSWYKATMDYIRDLNEKEGGIKGCQIKVETLDYGYNTAAAMSAYAAWKADTKSWDETVAILGWGTNDSVPLAQNAKNDKKPYISASYFAALGTPESIQGSATIPVLSDFTEVPFEAQISVAGAPYNFFAGTDYSTGARIAMFYVALQKGNRVGFFHCMADYCTGPLNAARQGAKDQNVARGRELIVELTDTQETYNTKVADYFRQELTHQKANPDYTIVDWVWSGNTTKTTAYMAKALANMKALAAAGDITLPQNTNVQLIVNNWGFDEMLYGLCGPPNATNPCVDKVHGIMPFAAYGDTRAPDMNKVTALHDRWRAIDGEPTTTAYKNVRYVAGYVNVLVFKKGVEAVLASGKSLTGENLKAALEKFNQESTGGLTANITYTETDHRPQGTESIYKINASGNLVLEGGQPFSIKMEDAWKGW